MTTRRLITDPGAAHPAKNATAPGLPNQPRSDSKGRNPMVGEQIPRQQVEQIRQRALRQLAKARAALELWVFTIGLDAHHRTDSDIPQVVVADPAYDRALEIYHQFITAYGRFEEQAAQIEAGEIR